jgi:hypothetical protein
MHEARFSGCSAWRPLETAPRDKDVILVVNAEGKKYRLLRPARLTDRGWVTSRTGTILQVHPLKWCLPYGRLADAC